jgi:hypothetical protein
MSEINLRQLAEQLPQAEVAQGERCRSLRCKGMYLNYGLGQNERVAGDGNFWCAKTQRIFGPDDQLVGDGVCRHTGRGCYEES